MDSETAIVRQGGGVDFGRTRWSMVAAVRTGREEQARRSLSELCRRYWVPVYAYVRCCGYAPENAASLVEGFLSHLVRRLRADQFSVDTGFRAYLQTELEDFLAHDGGAHRSTDPVSGMGPPWPLEQIEQRQRVASSAERSPAQALQRAFALEMLAIALGRLRKEAADSERGELFEAVRPFLSREPTQSQYAALAENMQISPLAAVIAVKRLRQRFQELVDEELAQTVGDRASLETERHTLLSLVSPGTEA